MMDNLNKLIYGDMEKALKTIRQIDEKKDADLERLREENKRLREEYSKDEEIQKLQAELKAAKENASRGFIITEEQQEAINEWKRKHEEEMHGLKTLDDKLSNRGAIGGNYQYIFTPTSIGVSGVIRCSCGAEFEFQEIG